MGEDNQDFNPRERQQIKPLDPDPEFVKNLSSDLDPTTEQTSVIKVDKSTQTTEVKKQHGKTTEEESPIPKLE